ncbi:hypothetical protein I5M27_18430 [Adhaeribacter sp. BT258]|uniref:Uncharacterized protein n=1 Tax=Adhaeribacter terrigena TaxID=2793070 RepID=A0ABS1C6G5_9BACT|nr:hypothetical protein [Adhaeribacter terrigena]MBK0404968.1 hypothetical protein [Adhaeribacter terrigena]
MKKAVSLLVLIFLSLGIPVSKAGFQGGDILLNNSKRHNFSNNQSPDIFRLILKGKDLVNAEATFSITNSFGREIFKETFPASDLIGYEITVENPSIIKKEEVIKKRANEFFIEKNFLNPAISPKEEFDEDYAEETIWKDIKMDRTAIGFFYLLGEEGLSWIAYSKKTGKVVMYRTCC